MGFKDWEALARGSQAVWMLPNYHLSPASTTVTQLAAPGEGLEPARSAGKWVGLKELQGLTWAPAALACSARVVLPVLIYWGGVAAVFPGG